MKKKFIVLLIIMISLFNISGQSFNPFNLSLDVNLGVDTLMFFREGKAYLATSLWDNVGRYSAFNEDEIVVGADGFPRISLVDTEFIFIYGGRRNIILYTPERPIGIDTYIMTTAIPLIKNANGSSYLVETLRNKEVAYNAHNLISTTIEDPYLGVRHWNLNNNVASGYEDSYPWVEGEDGFGIGQWLELDFTKAVLYFSILNGYVDPKRPYLYYQNGRVKKIKIESLDLEENFTIECSLSDEVSFQTIRIPEKSSQVKITVLDVYPGSKYEDTAITGIFLLPTSEDIESLTGRYISFEDMQKSYHNSDDRSK